MEAEINIQNLLQTTLRLILTGHGKYVLVSNVHHSAGARWLSIMIEELGVHTCFLTFCLQNLAEIILADTPYIRCCLWDS